ncbi:MAG: hypothetical protein WCP91_03710 [Candidatus Berkelbacteria bacterium]
MSEQTMQQMLAQGVRCGVPEMITHALEVNSRVIECRIDGKYPLVIAVENKDLAAISALRGYEISEAQWQAASQAAADADEATRAAIANKASCVPKPLAPAPA